MKVMITGASGFLGSRLKAYLQERGYELLTPSHRELEICSAQACLDHIRTQRPDVVVHCAALSNTGYCEEHPEESYRVNVEGTTNLAAACAATNARLIYMSSDQVYNGTKLDGLLPEDAPLSPVNHYGRHKLLAEQKVAQILDNAAGLRLTWMYDKPESTFPNTGGILCVMKNAHDKGLRVKANPKEHRAFTDVWKVVTDIEKLLGKDARGVFNFGEANELDSFETYKKIALSQGYAESLIERDDSRPGRNLSMNVDKIRKILE